MVRFRLKTEPTIWDGISITRNKIITNLTADLYIYSSKLLTLIKKSIVNLTLFDVNTNSSIASVEKVIDRSTLIELIMKGPTSPTTFEFNDLLDKEIWYNQVLGIKISVNDILGLIDRPTYILYNSNEYPSSITLTYGAGVFEMIQLAVLMADDQAEPEKKPEDRVDAVPDAVEEASSDRIRYRDPLDIDYEPVKDKWHRFTQSLLGITRYSFFDDKLRFRLGTRFQVDGTLASPSEELDVASLGEMTDTADFRRLRLFGEGILWSMYFRTEFEFAEDAGFKSA